MATRVSKAWATVSAGRDEIVITLQYTGEGKIDTLIRNAIKAINQSAGVAVRHYKSVSFKEWGKTIWAHESGQTYNQTTVTYTAKG